jgi:hypothetical protein
MLKLISKSKKWLDKTKEFILKNNIHFKEILIFILWDIFCPKKRNKLIESLENGKSFKFSYKDAKNLK